MGATRETRGDSEAARGEAAEEASAAQGSHYHSRMESESDAPEREGRERHLVERHGGSLAHLALAMSLKAAVILGALGTAVALYRAAQGGGLAAVKFPREGVDATHGTASRHNTGGAFRRKKSGRCRRPQGTQQADV